MTVVATCIPARTRTHDPIRALFHRGQTRTWTYTYNIFCWLRVQNPRTDVTAITNYGTDDGALMSITDALTTTHQQSHLNTGGADL